MQRKLLYYPYIDIPSKELIRKAILYWDKLSTIVPYEYDFQKHLNSEVEMLFNEGIYEPKSTSDLFLNEELFNDFKNRIIKYFQGRPYYQKKSLSKIHNNKFPKVKIHINKHIYYLIDFLEEKGLIVGKSGEWVYMPQNVAQAYMSILATYLAKADEDYTIPITDEEKYEKIAFNLKRLRKTRSLTYSIGLQILMENLPAPSPEVPLEKIIKFKEKHRYELLNFRKFLDEQFSSIKNSEDEYELKEKIIKFKENLEKEIYEIKFLLDDYHVETMTFSAKALLEIIPKIFIKPIETIGNIGNIISLPIKKKQLENAISKNELSYIYYGFQENIFEK